MKYIPAEKLIAEIERRLYFDNNWIEGDKKRQMHTSGVSSSYYKKIGSKHACESILDFITSLQHEQPKVDLEKEIEAYYGMYRKDGITYAIDNNEVCLDWKEGVNPTFIIDFARHFYELGLNARKEE